MKSFLLPLLLLGSSIIISCNKSDPAPIPSITGFSPASGPVASSVTLTGVNFSSAPEGNEVKFNGLKAVVTASSGTSLRATVPSGATSGVITVTVGGQSAISATSFTVNPLVGAWRFTGTTATNCDNPDDDGATTCSTSCPTLTFTANTIVFAFSGGSFNFNYTLVGSTLTISSPGGSFSPNYVLAGGQLTLVYPPDQCSVTETYVKI